MSVASIAQQRRDQQTRLAKQSRYLAMLRWSGIRVSDLAGSWSESLPLVSLLVARLQIQASRDADRYHRAVMEAQHSHVRPAGKVRPEGFTGPADGRNMDSLLWQPMIYTKTLIGQGVTPQEALERGGLALALIAEQEVRDAGRVADGVASFADRAVGGYVRYLNLPSCSRCVVLAGKFYLVSAGFERHPGCDCVHVSVPKGKGFAAWDLRQDGAELVRDGDIRGLSEADQRAIADGADLDQVVNAHRGMYTASDYGRTLKATREGTTKRGFAGQRMGADFAKAAGGSPYRRSTAPRLRPEAIYQLAGEDMDEALRLLKHFGYLI